VRDMIVRQCVRDMIVRQCVIMRQCVNVLGMIVRQCVRVISLSILPSQTNIFKMGLALFGCKGKHVQAHTRTSLHAHSKLTYGV